MHNLPCWVLSLFVALAAPAMAEVGGIALPPPDPELIRQQYQENEADWPEIPLRVLQAFVAAEDRHFFDELVQNSTITQQIAIWFAVPDAGPLRRRALAIAIGETLTHDEVLDWYANGAFFGQACFGVADAAGAYFGKTPDELSLGESAYLAALPGAPVLLNPLRSYDRAVERRNVVLSEMAKADFISAAEAAEASRGKLTVAQPLESCDPEP